MGALSPDTMAETNSLLRHLIAQAGNTTLTTSDLNPPFTPNTSAVRQNCLFFASLFSSLLAAAGAVLAKQCLSNYERTGQTGTFKAQGLYRTQRFLGAEKWKLRYVVEALPMLILVSLGLFFIALADYVWTVNYQVAIVITAFSAVGAFFYALMLISAAIYPLCPFQTAPSLILSDIAPAVARELKAFGMRATFAVSTAITPMTRKISRWIHRGRHPTTLPGEGWQRRVDAFMEKSQNTLQQVIQSPRKAHKDDKALHTEAVKLLMILAPSDDVVLSVCGIVMGMSDLGDVRAISTNSLPLRVASCLDSTLSTLRRLREVRMEESAVSLAAALTHILLATPMTLGSPVRKQLTPHDKGENLD